MGLLTGRLSMGAAGALLAASILLSRLLGLLRDTLVAALHGATAATDVYFAAFILPDFLNYLLAGGYFSITLVPLLARRQAQGEAQAQAFLSAVFTWVVLASLGLTALAMVLAPWLAPLTAPGFGPAELTRLTRYMRIVLPAQVFFLMGAVFTALLYQRRQFLVPALTPLVYNLGIIAGGLLGRELGMEGFCWGVLAGSAVGNGLLPWLAARAGGLQLRPTLRHPDLRAFLLLALPLMVGQSVVVLDEQLVRLFGSLAGEGAVSWLNYARRLLLVPVGVVAQAAGVASFPFLASLAAAADWQRFDASLATALRATVAFLLPMTVWLLVAAEPAVGLIFGHGRLGSADVAATALALRIMLVGGLAWGVQQLVGRAFYATGDTLTPSLTGTLITGASLPAYWLLARSHGAPGVALAGVLAVAGYALAVALLWRRRRGAGGFAGLGTMVGRVLLACLLASLPALAAQHLLVWPRGFWGRLWQVAASGGLFVAAWLLAARLLAPEAAALVLHRLLRRRPAAGA